MTPAEEEKPIGRVEFRAPRCSHDAPRPWTPIIEARVPREANRLLGRYWIPGEFCEACTKLVTGEHYRFAVAAHLGKIPPAAADDAWTILWTRVDQVAALVKPRPRPESINDFRRAIG